MSDIALRVRQVFLRHVPVDALDRLPAGETYLQALGLDSPALLSLIVDLEDTFGVEIASQDLYRLKTLDDVIATLSRRP